MKFFENAYLGRPTWETGRPQPAVVGLAEAGRIAGRVLDAGCGTGVHAAFLASRGIEVVGVDFVSDAIDAARARASERGVRAEFLVGDALNLESLPGLVAKPFDSAIDVGLFHCLQPVDRGRYSRSVASVVRPGGALFVLAWSDRNPFGRGPERVSRGDLRAAFRARWEVVSIVESFLETNLSEGRVHAWLAEMRRR